MQKSVGPDSWVNWDTDTLAPRGDLGVHELATGHKLIDRDPSVESRYDPGTRLTRVWVTYEFAIVDPYGGVLTPAGDLDIWVAALRHLRQRVHTLLRRTSGMVFRSKASVSSPIIVPRSMTLGFDGHAYKI